MARSLRLVGMTYIGGFVTRAEIAFFFPGVDLPGATASA